MIAWWKELSRRERLLIAAVAGLACVLLFVVAIVRPLLGFRDSAVQKLATAQTTAVYVTRAVASANQADGRVQSAENLRGIVTGSAQQAGLRWINIRQGQDGLTLTISFSGVSTDDLFGWLIDLEERESIVVQDARLSDSRSGTGVEASITFTQGV